MICRIAFLNAGKVGSFDGFVARGESILISTDLFLAKIRDIQTSVVKVQSVGRGRSDGKHLR